MTDPVTLTRPEMYEEMRAIGWNGLSLPSLVDAIQQRWPNGVRIVPDPIPEPGPEVAFVTFETPEGELTRYARDTGGWVRYFGTGTIYTWGGVLDLYPAKHGWTLTEYVAKDGAK